MAGTFGVRACNYLVSPQTGSGAGDAAHAMWFYWPAQGAAGSEFTGGKGVREMAGHLGKMSQLAFTLCPAPQQKGQLSLTAPWPWIPPRLLTASLLFSLPWVQFTPCHQSRSLVRPGKARGGGWQAAEDRRGEPAGYVKGEELLGLTEARGKRQRAGPEAQEQHGGPRPGLSCQALCFQSPHQAVTGPGKSSITHITDILAPHCCCDK